MKQSTELRGRNRRTPTRTGAAASWSLAVGLLTALLSAGVIAEDLVTVSQREQQFAPSHLTLVRGATVRILNDDKVIHHVYVDAPKMSFDSGEQPVGSAVELRFNERGTFDVQCAIHPVMLLRVTVE
jgi:plastocyanin